MVSADRLEQLISEQWSRAEGRNTPYDFVADNGALVLEVKRLSGSARDLHAAVTQLAVALEENPSIRRGYLLAQMPRMTVDRASAEWKRVQRVLRPKVGERLTLIAIGAGGAAVLPDDDERALSLAALARDALEGLDAHHGSPEWRPSEKFFDIWKVLLAAWLAREGSLRIGEVARRAGCSYPTVAKSLERLMDRREIQRDTSRSVKLRAFPSETLSQLLVLSESLRRPIRFVDATGRQPDPQVILRRLQKKNTPGVALGGVVAARHYDRHFDLHGLPRLDVVMAKPVEIGWVRSVDPALRQSSLGDAEPVLVVRRSTRPDPGFVDRGRSELPVADAVETLLDLYELRLDSQAEDLVRVLRDGGNPP